MKLAMYLVPAAVGATAFYFGPSIPGLSGLASPTSTYAYLGVAAATGALAAHLSGHHILVGAGVALLGALAINYSVGTQSGKLALS